jgi:hypothetical protein
MSNLKSFELSVIEVWPVLCFVERSKGMSQALYLG